MTAPPERHDAYARQYDNDVRANGAWQADALFGLCAEYVTPGMRLLDVGIGTGHSSEPFARLGAHITGMDFAPAMLEIARRKPFPSVLVQHDLMVRPWPFETASFDMVVSCGVTYFMPDLEPLVSEVARVLRTGGVFATTVLRPFGHSEAGAHYTHDVINRMDVYGHRSEYTRHLFASAHFEPAKVLRCFVAGNSLMLHVLHLRPVRHAHVQQNFF